MRYNVNSIFSHLELIKRSTLVFSKLDFPLRNSNTKLTIEVFQKMIFHNFLLKMVSTMEFTKKYISRGST